MTGKLLASLLGFRLIKEGTKFKYPILNLIRWGCSAELVLKHPVRRDAKIINDKVAVALAANKKEMIQKLNEDGIKIPKFLLISNDTTIEQITPFSVDGMVFARSKQNVVSYITVQEVFDNKSRYGYITKPIRKKYEYRVHVFNGEVIAIYRKEPLDPNNATIRKAENCHFSLRSNVSDIILSRSIQAVQSLGLVFGGVDIVMDYHQTAFVLEVNSSPALNDTNAERWVEKFKQYFEIGG